MPFAFRERGERKKLAAHIADIKQTGADGKPLDDQSLIDSAKAAILAQLDTLPNTFNGALVICEGHANENSRSIMIQIIGENGHY